MKRSRQAYGNFLVVVGRIDESLGYLEHARAIDPLDTNLAGRIAELYAATGNFAAALAEIDRGMASADDQQNLRGAGLMTALVMGDREEIEKRLKLLLAYDTSIKLMAAINAKMAQLLDDREAALKELRRLETDPATRTPIVRGAILVQWAAYFGDPDFALELYRSLPMSVQRPYIFIVWRRVFREVRKRPGFKDLLRDVGLVDYWRATGKWADFCHPFGDKDFECE